MVSHKQETEPVSFSSWKLWRPANFPCSLRLGN